MYRTNYTHKTNNTFARCEQNVRASFTFVLRITSSLLLFNSLLDRNKAWKKIEEKNKKNNLKKNPSRRRDIHSSSDSNHES